MWGSHHLLWGSVEVVRTLLAHLTSGVCGVCCIFCSKPVAVSANSQPLVNVTRAQHALGVNLCVYACPVVCLLRAVAFQPHNAGGWLCCVVLLVGLLGVCLTMLPAGDCHYHYSSSYRNWHNRAVQPAGSQGLILITRHFRPDSLCMQQQTHLGARQASHH